MNEPKSRESFWDGSWLQMAFDFAAITPVTPRSDQVSMVFPLFALAAKDTSELKYTDSRNGATISVKPGHNIGRATIEDRDLLLFIVSVSAPQVEKNPADWLRPRTVRFRLADYYAFIGTEKPGASQLRRVEAALERLSATRVKTTICTNNERVLESFSLVQYYKITEPLGRQRGRGHAITVDIEICQWLHNAILSHRELLWIDRQYFKLPPLARRMYDIGRKHCGDQASWTIGYERLLELIGSRQAPKYLFAELRKIAAEQPLPGYVIELHPGAGLDKKGQLIVRSRAHLIKQAAHGGRHEPTRRHNY